MTIPRDGQPATCARFATLTQLRPTARSAQGGARMLTCTGGYQADTPFQRLMMTATERGLTSMKRKRRP